MLSFAALYVVVLALQQQVLAQTVVRVCVPTAGGDKARCEAWFAQAMPTSVSVTCVFRENEDLCLDAIQNGEADIVRGGGDMVFKAKVDYNLDAYLAEDYGVASGTAYYGVAIVKKEMCDARNNDLRLSDLQGKRACTTGYRRTAGWTLPVGFMVTSGLMPVVARETDVQEDAQSMASFFSSVCAPGTTDGAGNSAGPRNDGSEVGLPYDKLCTGCAAGGKTCGDDSEYGDYEGALRCMVEGHGDVAFVKHTTPGDYERNRAGRPEFIAQNDLRIVCADNSGCEPVSAFDRGGCSYGSAPAHAFVARPANQAASAFAVAMAAASNEAGTSAAWLQTGKDLKLISSTVERLATPRAAGAATNIVDYVTPTSFSYFKTIRDLQAVAPAASGGSGSKLSDGAIAGIVIGCVVGTALIAGIIAMLVMKRQKNKLWEQFSSTNNGDLNGKFVAANGGHSPVKAPHMNAYQV